VRNHPKRSAWSVLTAVAGIAAVTAAITASASAHSAKPAAASTPTITLYSGVGPQSLDPGLDYTTQGAEINWLVYTPLVTYQHKSGLAGTELIPGLAKALPAITNKGKTYTAYLRSGLKFSNGDPVVASDFTLGIERALKVPWGAASIFLYPIAGAEAYATGKATTISGITTDNATGKIVINLTAAYGPLDNVLAFPNTAPVDPKSVTGNGSKATPFKIQAGDPPIGDGPYETADINVGGAGYTSFDLNKNPNWASQKVPGIPDGIDNFVEKVDSNVEANALSVEKNPGEVFDWADTIPGAVVSSLQTSHYSNYSLKNLGGSTYYIFLNATKAPFNNQDAREAVVTGLNEAGYDHLGSGTLAPGCYFLPPALPGYDGNSKDCPYGSPSSTGSPADITKAKKLVAESGQANVPITVYTEERSPRLNWMEYYANELKSIGFTHVKLEQVSDANYFTTIGESKKVDPQTGFADWNMDFPNPVDFYGVLLAGNSIQATNNENFGQTNDPYINSEVAKLGAVPTTQLSSVDKQWQAVDQYVAKKAYVAVFGYQTFPFFASTNVNVPASAINDINGWDLSQLSLK
jgi:peptide/nickel transport system substrate-binding protein